MTDINNMDKQPNEYSYKFANAEVLWFWFVASKRIKTGFIARQAAGGNRPCEVIDIEVLITRLHLSGKISSEGVRVITRYGFLRRAPNRNHRFEERDADNWCAAMDAINAAAKSKGWLE
ncbi:MAG: hypothetical protein LBG89_03930 [Rickettsiales bacterium]|nr:hypothetical protein [Rickettsiales bacterium]